MSNLRGLDKIHYEDSMKRLRERRPYLFDEEGNLKSKKDPLGHLLSVQEGPNLPVYLGRKEEDLDLIKRYGKMQREKEPIVKKQTVMKAKTKSKGKTVKTEMQVKKDITDKIKSAIKKYVIAALENELKDTELLYDSFSSDKEFTYGFPEYTSDEERWFFDEMEDAIKHGDKPEEVGGIPYEILNKFKNQYKSKSTNPKKQTVLKAKTKSKRKTVKT